MNKVQEGLEILLTAVIVIFGFAAAGSFISEVCSTAKSQYLIRAENHKYYADSYERTEDGICFTDTRTKQKVIVYGNAVIEER